MKELKTMIRAYHEAGISVVLDVVYNHIYSTEHGPFQIQCPIIITGWSQMVVSKMGQVLGMKRLVSMKCTASTIDSPHALGQKSTRSMASALIWWVFTM